MGLKVIVSIVISWAVVVAYVMTTSWQPIAKAEPSLKFVDAPGVVMSINRNEDRLMSITIYGEGKDGKPIVIIHPTGFVTLNGDPNEAARQFWKAVGYSMPACKEGP